MSHSSKVAALLAVTLVTHASPVFAEDCASRVTRSNLVACALSVSPALNVARTEIDAADARKTSVSSVLPANPTLGLALARRSATGEATATNWDARLSQEVEVAGQRGVRRAAAQAEIDARTTEGLLVRREIAADAWVAFFDLLSAEEEQELAARLSMASQIVVAAARGRAEKGVIAPIDADVADAAATRVYQAKLAADRRLAEANATLASMMGADPNRSAIVANGALVPIAGIDLTAASLGANASATRLEVRVLDAERHAFELRADAYRRTRIPNPTVSLFVQNDGFDERVLGVGLAFPIPLPGNVGRTYVGEIAEADAFARRTAAERQRFQRAVRLEVVVAAQAYASRKKEVDAFPLEKTRRAEDSLRSLGEEIEAGRLSIRDAVITEQALIELLQAGVAARRAWCLASIDLALATGAPLEGGAL